jgi:RNA polymerase sigma-70 factor (sigma-E family)
VFEEFVAARGQALQRVAYLLTGDWGLAEDLLQTSLARAYSRWSGIECENPEAYVRQIMLNTWCSWWRRNWRGEVPTAALPDPPGRDCYADADRRDALRTALAGLPRRQRAVVVLRYHLDLPEQQVAEMLGISTGTVKSQAAKALAKLRCDGALDEYRTVSRAGGG